MSPAPSIGHRLVVQRLATCLSAACPASSLVLPGPGVAVSRFQYRIPDLVVVSAGSIHFDDKAITVPPLLAIEVASPSTAIYDKNRKREVYERFGIQFYWIVTPDPAKPVLTALELRGREYHIIEEVRHPMALAVKRRVRKSFPIIISGHADGPPGGRCQSAAGGWAAVPPGYLGTLFTRETKTCHDHCGHVNSDSKVCDLGKYDGPCGPGGTSAARAEGLCGRSLAAMPPGGVLVVSGAGLQAAVQDAGLAVGEAAQRVGVVDLA
jgi:hypothetical protein